MTKYEYENIEVKDLQALIVNIEKSIGVSPIGISSGSAKVTEIEFDNELTSEQKDSLDSFMSGTNLDSKPVKNGNTVFKVDNVFYKRKELSEASGLDFSIYITGDTYELHFDHTLTDKEKSDFNIAFGATLKEV